ncbi:MAG: hypothetical protein DRR08_26665 [Candidatus Parabeggiatoa sp. nov. 2]|nr:MAG: hypothetical protein B6247_10830 [Beggiatoa sp. 4572_84]RKZ54221.1 MAG: hypothetical protein DRR08_26665 [Gammaproteobacteria bacterium]
MTARTDTEKQRFNKKPMNTANIPQTDSIEELAQFWNTHDLTDFEEQLQEITEPIFERNPETCPKIKE